MNTKKEMVPLIMDKNDLFWLSGFIGGGQRHWDKAHQRQSKKVIKIIYEAISEYENRI